MNSYEFMVLIFFSSIGKLMYPKQIQCIFYALLVGRSHPQTEKTWSVGMIIPAKLAGKLIKSLRFFSSNPICLNMFGCNFPIFTGLFTFLGVNLRFCSPVLDVFFGHLSRTFHLADDGDEGGGGTNQGLRSQ